MIKRKQLQFSGKIFFDVDQMLILVFNLQIILVSSNKDETTLCKSSIKHSGRGGAYSILSSPERVQKKGINRVGGYLQNQMIRTCMIASQLFYPILCGFSIGFYESNA